MSAMKRLHFAMQRNVSLFLLEAWSHEHRGVAREAPLHRPFKIPLLEQLRPAPDTNINAARIEPKSNFEYITITIACGLTELSGRHVAAADFIHRLTKSSGPYYHPCCRRYYIRRWLRDTIKHDIFENASRLSF